MIDTATVHRDLAALDEHLKAAQRAAREGKSWEAWDHMDRLDARLQGLSIYITIAG